MPPPSGVNQDLTRSSPEPTAFSHAIGTSLSRQSSADHGIMILTCPGEVIEMTPAQAHMHWLVLFRAGWPPIMTVGDPGVQGPVGTGMQGCGVSTPSAAEVAEATWGFASDMHMAKGGMFTIGAMSMIFAAGGPPPMAWCGDALNALGAIPKLHWSIAPVTTRLGIVRGIGARRALPIARRMPARPEGRFHGSRAGAQVCLGRSRLNVGDARGWVHWSVFESMP